MTQFCNVGTPLISRERLKLNTSNLARKRTAVSSKIKCKFRSKGVMWWSLDPVIEFLDPPYTSRLVEARNFKFFMETDGVNSNAKKCKIWSKGVMWGSRDPLLEFWHSLISGVWLKLNFIFGIENDDNIIILTMPSLVHFF